MDHQLFVYIHETFELLSSAPDKKKGGEFDIIYPHKSNSFITFFFNEIHPFLKKRTYHKKQ